MLGDFWSDLPRSIATVTAAPAAGLADRGRLEVGTRADVIRVSRSDQIAVVHGVWVQGQRIG